MKSAATKKDVDDLTGWVKELVGPLAPPMITEMNALRSSAKTPSEYFAGLRRVLADKDYSAAVLARSGAPDLPTAIETKVREQMVLAADQMVARHSPGLSPDEARLASHGILVKWATQQYPEVAALYEVGKQSGDSRHLTGAIVDAAIAESISGRPSPLLTQMRTTLPADLVAVLDGQVRTIATKLHP